MASNKLLSKILYFLGIEDEEPPVHQHEDPLGIPARQERGRVINIHQIPKNRVTVFRPTCFDEVKEISEELKNRRAVIVNLEGMDKDTGRRILDFLSGSVFVLDGTVKKVGSGTFVFAPNNVDITGFNLDEIESGKEKPLYKS
ncbi:MAG: cell division inhibitor SepF [Tepidanaerobacteraceae bacterium]|nr:cell division inhibitor SepF [Tepidanaerobacteraceae bacterium]